MLTEYENRIYSRAELREREIDTNDFSFMDEVGEVEGTLCLKAAARDRIHFFSCSNYEKEYRGSCKSRHYIRADAVEQIVKLELRQIGGFMRTDEEGFAELLAQKTQKDLLAERNTLRQNCKKRSAGMRQS